MPQVGGGGGGGGSIQPVSTISGGSVSDAHQFTGSVYVSGAIYAHEYNVDSITKTITNIDQSGSTKFGNSSDDMHEFSGSIYASNIGSGSVAGAGSYVALGPNNQLILTASSGGGGGTTINNATENEIVTVAGNTSQLDAEANLTFDGSTVRLKGFMSTPVGVFNSSSIDDTVSLPSNYRCLLYGPITIGSQGEFTIGSDSSVKIKSWDDV